jgi:hypothetical protein
VSSSVNQKHWDNSLEVTAYALCCYLIQQGIDDMDIVLLLIDWVVQKYCQNEETQTVEKERRVNIKLWLIITSVEDDKPDSFWINS